MKIDQKFNRLTLKEYYFYIDNHKKYTDFNTLGLYRSILENEKLNVEEKIQVRDYAHKSFQKQFDFLQLKDPYTFVQNKILGMELTKADESKIWDEVKINQQKILVNKQIKHRNFGIYSKHECGYETCNLDGLMIKQGSFFTEAEMHFHSDKSNYGAEAKSERIKKNRKQKSKIVKTDIELD